MNNHFNVGDFGAVDKKDKSKFVKMNSIFVLPKDTKIIKKINNEEKELMKIQKDKIKAKGGEIKSINIGVVKVDNKKMGNIIKPDNNVKPRNENLLLLDKARKIKRD